MNTYNAERYLEEVLRSLRGFDEIVVVDMHSTDCTREIAAAHGARIVDFERCGICEPARNAAIQAATSPWVLIVDADEVVPERLREYLYEVAARADAPTALRIPRRNSFMGRELHSLYRLRHPLRSPRCNRLAAGDTCSTGGFRRCRVDTGFASRPGVYPSGGEYDKFADGEGVAIC